MAAKNNAYVIGCKLPNGLTITHKGKTIHLLGANSSALINGFGITREVPAEAWDHFLVNHKSSKIVTNGIVFAVSDERSASAASLERGKVKTGLEQTDLKTTGVEPLTED